MDDTPGLQSIAVPPDVAPLSLAWEAVAQADGIVMDSASKAMDMLELVIERINSEHLKTVQRMLDAHEQEMKLCRKEYEGEIATLKKTVSQQGERIKLLEEENEKIKKTQTRDAVFDRIQQRDGKAPWLSRSPCRNRFSVHDQTCPQRRGHAADRAGKIP